VANITKMKINEGIKKLIIIHLEGIYLKGYSTGKYKLYFFSSV
jgi:hypothetical protein